MQSFRHRSQEKEFLDQPEINKKDLERNLWELDYINSHLGGHNVTIKGIEHFLNKNNTIKSIIDVGCGGGDTLAALSNFFAKKNIQVKLTGIDLLPEAIEFAKNKYGGLNIDFICTDYKDYPIANKHDLAINSLICHHLYENELFNFISFNRNISNYGFIINDLHRHPLAYYSIGVLTKLFSKSYMVKNDAPLSVKKGFIKGELSEVLKSSQIPKFKISWEWAFRLLVIAENEN